jgi:hypothetical protein
MTDNVLQIKNPSVTLYAFHLCQDLTQEPGQLRQDANQLWHNCANLSKPLAIPDLKSLPEKLQSQPTQAPIISDYVKLLPGNGRLKYAPPLQIKGTGLTVEVYPVQIHDTYALDLTLYYQNSTVPASQFSHLNPHGYLLASNIQASLGQTLLLYAEPVDSHEEDKNLADACVDAFLQETKQERPALVEVGQLFGSPIFEYDNGQEKPGEQCHILVWFNRHPETLNLAQKTYFSFLNLLCCRSKIFFAYHEARWCYHQTRRLYAQMEQEVQLFQQLPNQPEVRLEQLKQKLTQIPPKTFEYTSYLRDIEDHQTAIATNAKNYDYWLRKIRESSLEGDDLKFLENFLNQTCQRFQDQIQVDLSYLSPGQQLLDQMLGTIRGIVEIEQAESDRALEKALREKEEAAEKREKSLELWIALVGTGLAVSGISSQTDAKPVEAILTHLNPNQPLDCPKAGLNPCLFYSGVYVVFHVLVGVIAASVLGLIIWLVSKRKKENSPKPRRSCNPGDSQSEK